MTANTVQKISGNFWAYLIWFMWLCCCAEQRDVLKMDSSRWLRPVKFVFVFGQKLRWSRASWCWSLFTDGQDTADANDTRTLFTLRPLSLNWGNSLPASLPPPSAGRLQVLSDGDPIPSAIQHPLPWARSSNWLVRALLAHSPCTLCASARLQLLGGGGGVQDNIGQALAGNCARVTCPPIPTCSPGLYGLGLALTTWPIYQLRDTFHVIDWPVYVL